MEYKIGTVAKLLGISPEGPRLYERNGILVSHRRKGENGYRYYSRLDITALLRARAYHQYGFSLKETEALINADDVQYIGQEYRQRAESLEEEIRRKQHTLDYLRQISALVEQLPSQLWTIRPETSPGIHRLEFMQGDELILEPEHIGLFAQWAGLAPLPLPPSGIPGPAWRKGPTRVSPLWAFWKRTPGSWECLSASPAASIIRRFPACTRWWNFPRRTPPVSNTWPICGNTSTGIICLWPAPPSAARFCP